MERGKDKHSFFTISSERKVQSSESLIHKAVKVRSISWETASGDGTGLDFSLSRAG